MSHYDLIMTGIILFLVLAVAMLGFLLGSNRSKPAEMLLHEEIGKWDAAVLMSCCPECQKERRQEQIL